MCERLEGWRRDLAADHADLIDQAAASVRTRWLDRAERRSIAGYQLCLAAIRWPEGSGNFRGWAMRFMRFQIMDADRWAWRWSGTAIDGRNMIDDGDPWRPVEDADQARSLAGHIESLPAAEREALRLYCEGMELADIARTLGVRKDSACRLRSRAVRRLRAAAGA